MLLTNMWGMAFARMRASGFHELRSARLVVIDQAEAVRTRLMARIWTMREVHSCREAYGLLVITHVVHRPSKDDDEFAVGHGRLGAAVDVLGSDSVLEGHKYMDLACFRIPLKYGIGDLAHTARSRLALVPGEFWKLVEYLVHARYAWVVYEVHGFRKYLVPWDFCSSLAQGLLLMGSVFGTCLNIEKAWK